MHALIARHALAAQLLLLVGVWPAAVASSAAAPADGILRALDARYDVYAGGVRIGETHWTLESLGGGRFAYESRTRPVGVASLLRDERVVERSEWRLHQGRLQPLAYRYDRTRGDKRRQVIVDFDWAAGRVENTAGGRTWAMQLPPGTLDKLSYVLVMMKELADGRRDLSYAVADGGKVKTYRLTVTGEEVLETGLGRLSTLKLKRERASAARETFLWCAGALDYLPVRIHHREKDGTVFELRLREVEGFSGAGATLAGQREQGPERPPGE